MEETPLAARVYRRRIPLIFTESLCRYLPVGAFNQKDLDQSSPNSAILYGVLGLSVEAAGFTSSPARGVAPSTS